MPPKRTFARLDTFTRGQIWGMKLGGMPREEMLEHVWKKDGTELTLHTLDDVIKKKTDYPDWMGEDKARSLCPACHLPLKCSFRLKARELDNFAKWATVYWPTHPPLELRELSEEGQVEC